MKYEYVKLEDYNVLFKHLISGPATVGRILNYTILTGNDTLYHKNGHRDLYLTDNIGSAWCTEFMVGLGLVYYDREIRDGVFKLHITDSGKELYKLIKDYTASFDESRDPSKCYAQLISYNENAYNLFFEIFKASPVCKNLCAYIQNSGTNEFLKTTFVDDYFECFLKYYEGGTYNRNARTPTGANRVPSLIQLCQFFKCLEIVQNTYIFDFEKLSKIENNHITYIPINDLTLSKLDNENVRNERIVNDLVEKYGFDGNVLREIITRNSTVQEIFRNNLIANYGCKCAICNKNIETVLIASHIVPASESNVIEKADCENGLLLCALHDKLFDRHLISFDFNGGKLLYSKELENHLDEYQLTEDMCLENRFLTEKRCMYLMNHNMAFYERNK